MVLGRDGGGGGGGGGGGIAMPWLALTPQTALTLIAPKSASAALKTLNLHYKERRSKLRTDWRLMSHRQAAPTH